MQAEKKQRDRPPHGDRLWRQFRPSQRESTAAHFTTSPRQMLSAIREGRQNRIS